MPEERANAFPAGGKINTTVSTDAKPKAVSARKSLPLLWLEGCGAGVLLMLPFVWLQISPLHTDLYHRSLPMNTVFGGIAIDFVIACLLCISVFWLLRRSDPDGNTLWWVLIAAVLAIKTIDFIIVGNFGAPIGGLIFLVVNCFALAVVFWLLERSWYRKVVRWSCRGLALLGVCILWMLPQLVYMAVRPEPHDVQKFVRSVAPARVPHRRIVWILFDELSQDQVFDHRQPGISLPQLDHFRSQSVMFSDLRPAGYYTQDVVPSLLLGKEISGIHSDLAGNLFVKTSSQWQQFPMGRSLFADAQREGWSTGVAGWYNPYCRTYATYLDWCAWTWRLPIEGNYQQGRSLWRNVNAPLIPAEAMLMNREGLAVTEAAWHAADYKDLMRFSHELIDDSNIGFVFLHLPLPHPGGFYNRKTGQIGVIGSYLDNLALTDRSLGELMRWINQTPLASQTIVIVCSDHSWRVPLWRSTMTEEDKRASGGKFDTRPVLMVHFPGETRPGLVSRPFPAIKEHALIESLLHGTMNTNELEAWAAKQ